MKSFAREFLNEDFDSVPGAPAVYVAAFGKHAGWNDHMDDIGLVTESLVELKRSLYVQGVSSQIESGAWDRLGPEKIVGAFDHVFAWHRPFETIVGLIWSSRDGKGRQLYPMILCAQLVMQSLDWIWSEVIPRLEAAAESCRKATTPRDVIETLNTLQETLRRRATAVTASVEGVASRLSQLGVAKWTAHFAQDHAGLARICHHLAGRMEAAMGEADGELRSRCMRVPAIPGAQPAESLNAWLAFYNGQVDPYWPVLIFGPRSGGWFDVVMGEPSKEDYFRLRAAPAAEPVVSSIPYTISADLQRRIAGVVADVQAGRMPRQSFLNGEPAKDALETAAQKLASARRPARSFFSRFLR